MLATLVNHASLGPFFATFFENASTTDLWGSVVKTTLFGAIIAVVCCYKGMTASGGAEGVGRAVNQAVVIAFLGIFAFNYVFTQVLLATHPRADDDRQMTAESRSDVDRRQRTRSTEEEHDAGLARRAAGVARVVRRDRQVLREGASATSPGCGSSASSARRCVRPGS